MREFFCYQQMHIRLSICWSIFCCSILVMLGCSSIHHAQSMRSARGGASSSTSTHNPNRKAIPYIKDTSPAKQVDSMRKALESEIKALAVFMHRTKDEDHKRFLWNISDRTITEDKILQVIHALNHPKKYHTQAVCGMMPILLAVKAQNTEIVRLLLEKSENDDIGINHAYSINGIMLTPLSLALYFQNKEIIKLLLTHKEIDVNGSDELLSPLLLAFEQDDMDSLRIVAKNKFLKITGNYAYVVRKAIIRNKEDMLEILLKEAANRNKKQLIDMLNKRCCDFVDSPKNKKNGLPIFIAIDLGFANILALLLKYGAEIKNKYDKDFTPLICAIQKGNIDIVNLLIQNGASVSETDIHFKCSPLYYALSYFNAPIAQAILAADKAQRHRADDQRAGRIWERSFEYYELWYNGFVPWMLAPLMVRYYNCPLNARDKAFIQDACIHIITAIDFLEMCKKARERINADAYGMRFFDSRYCYRDADMTISDLLMKVLKKYAPNPNIDKNQDLDRDIDEKILRLILDPIVEFNFKAGSIADIKLAKGRNFLSYLSEYGSIDFVATILSHSAISKEHIDLASDDGRTPLAYAVINNHFPVIKQLVEKGANINAVDKQGNSILYYALHKDDMDDNIMAQYILQFFINKNKALSQSVAGLSLPQYHQLLQFIISRPRVNESLPMMELSTRLTQILEKEDNYVDNLLIQTIRTAAVKGSDKAAWQAALNGPNKQGGRALLLAIKKEQVPLVDALLAHQVYHESLLPNWKKWFAATCASKNVEILELLIKRLHACNAQDIMATLLTKPLHKGNNKTALFYAIDAQKQAIGEDPDPFIAYLIAHGAKLNQKLSGDMEPTPLLYALKVKANLSILQSLTTKASLQDVDRLTYGVLWYAVTYKNPTIVVDYIVKQLQKHSIMLPEICRIFDLNENQSIHDCLEAYFMYTSNNCMGYVADDEDPEIIWQENNQSVGKRSASTGLCLKVDGPKVGRLISWTKHVQDRAKQRKISEEQIVGLLSQSNKKLKAKYIITLRKGIIDGRNLCVVTGETNSEIFIITTYWIKDQKSGY